MLSSLSDSVTEGVFGTIAGGLLLFIIYGFCRKWLGDERLRAIFRYKEGSDQFPLTVTVGRLDTVTWVSPVNYYHCKSIEELIVLSLAFL